MGNQDFQPNDLGLLEAAIALNPDLVLAVHAAKLARGHKISYPIAEHAGLKLLFGTEATRLSLKGRQVTYVEFEQQFPREFFPIESEQDLVQKVAMAIAKVHHARPKPEPPRDERGNIILVGPSRSGNK